MASLMEEFELMKGTERKFNSASYREAKELDLKIKAK
jgi:hypothetical protein